MTERIVWAIHTTALAIAIGFSTLAMTLDAHLGIVIFPTIMVALLLLVDTAKFHDPDTEPEVRADGGRHHTIDHTRKSRAWNYLDIITAAITLIALPGSFALIGGLIGYTLTDTITTTGASLPFIVQPFIIVLFALTGTTLGLLGFIAFLEVFN